MNWIWRKWVDKPTENYFMINASSKDNPFLPQEYIETLIEEYTGQFAKQEIEGLFVGHELTEILGDLRVTLVAEIETNILVKFLLCILGTECIAD